MVSLTRLINWVALIGGSLLFFLLQGEVNIIQRVAGATILLALASLLIFTGRERLEIPSNYEKIETEEEAKTLPESPDQINIEVVKPKSEMRRTRGMSKFPVNMPAPPPLPVMIPPPSLPAQPPAISALQSPPIPDTQDVISTLPEGINVAKKYIAKGDAISDEEEEIERQRGKKEEKM